MNKKVYDKIFMEIFSLTEDKLINDLNILSLDNWDSVAQMQLVAALEEEFEIMLEPEDIIEFTSYLAGINILKKYGIEID